MNYKQKAEEFILEQNAGPAKIQDWEDWVDDFADFLDSQTPKIEKLEFNENWTVGNIYDKINEIIGKLNSLEK